MEFRHQCIFLGAADQFHVWILVRKTNPAALSYVGGSLFRPKPIECKAKAAKSFGGGRDVRGLVVDVRIHRFAFRGAQQEEARRVWEEFAPGGRLPPGYDVDTRTSSPWYGCVRLDGKYLHSDYDLYEIVDDHNPALRRTVYTTLRGQLHKVDPRFEPVLTHINRSLGLDMIQHDYWRHGGQHLDEEIEYFGPKFAVGKLRGLKNILKFYKETLGRREIIPPWQ